MIACDFNNCHSYGEVVDIATSVEGILPNGLFYY